MPEHASMRTDELSREDRVEKNRIIQRILMIKWNHSALTSSNGQNRGCVRQYKPAATAAATRFAGRKETSESEETENAKKTQ